MPKALVLKDKEMVIFISNSQKKKKTLCVSQAMYQDNKREEHILKKEYNWSLHIKGLLPIIYKECLKVANKQT